MNPRVIVYDAVSADGCVVGFEPDVGLFYELAKGIPEDCTLMGSETLLAAAEDDSDASPVPGALPGDTRPIMAVVDSRGRFRGYRGMMEFGAWSRAVALVSEETSDEYLSYLRQAGVEWRVVGEDRVDLVAALRYLSEQYGVELIRVESGGTLNGVLGEMGLVDEYHLLVHPVLAGLSMSSYRPPAIAASRPLELLSCEQQRGGILHIRWRTV